MKIITKHGDNLCFILIVIALALLLFYPEQE